MLRATAVVCVLVSLAVALASAQSLPNITAGYECNTGCTSCAAHGEMIQGGCTYVPPAKSYVIYTCMENNTKVQLEVFGPLEFMCSKNDPLHLTLTYPTETCVSPPAGGLTIYHCPNE